VLGGGSPEGIKFLEENKKKDGVITLPSGLQYKVLKKGAGAFHPTVSSPCSCHYEGKLVSGDVFDSSIARGSPTTFAPNQVIKGWTEIMQMMVEGDKFELYIPSDLAYGDRGSPPKIPAGATLIFTLELLEIQGDKVDAITCDPHSKDGCNEKEIKYIEKKISLAADKLATELERLKGMAGNKMKPELVEWITRRKNILEKLTSKDKDEL